MTIKSEDLIIACIIGFLCGFLTHRFFSLPTGVGFIEPPAPVFDSNITPSSEKTLLIGQEVGIQVEIKKLSPELEQAIIDFMDSFSSPACPKSCTAGRPSSEASPGPTRKSVPESGFFGPKRQSTETPSSSILARRCAANGKVGKQQSRPTFFETDVIRAAAERNGCCGDDFLILMAIRKAENGGVGKEFGVKGKAWGTDLDTQAAWAAATIVKNRARWSRAGKPPDFIKFLSKRYCPLDSQTWEKNVRFWFKRLKCEL